jgi:hypothetical protein
MWLMGAHPMASRAQPGPCSTCYANCDSSSVPPVLNINDFTCFLQKFALGDSYANCDGSTTVPILNVADFTCFLNRFAAGCPTLTVTPPGGVLGTVLTLTLSNPPSGCIFDASTTAVWTGTYTPSGEPPTSTFTLTFSAAQIHAVSDASAQIILGDGTPGNAPNIEQLGPTGTLTGDLVISFGSGAAYSQCVNIDVVANAVGWCNILYPRGFGGSQPPTLGPVSTQIELYRLTVLPDGSHPPETQLQAMTTFHFTPTLRVVKSPLADSQAPATVTVDVVSYRSDGVEIDRIHGMPLALQPASTDPLYLIYADLTRPVIFVDEHLEAGYGQVHLIYGEVNGWTSVVP